MPTVTVCIPVFNGEKFIEKTIKSVLQQSYTDYELLIIDNCSTDKTINIVNSFSDARINLIKNNQNIGLIGNWNRCLEYSKGKYIQFLCADDYLAKNCLEKKIEVFNKYSNICLVFNSSYIIDANDEIIMKRRPFLNDRLFDGKKIAYKSFIKRNLFGEPSNVMFKKDLIKEIGYFDSKLCYSVDWDYWIKISTKGKVYFINDYLMYYRVISNSITGKLLKEKKKLLEDDNQFITNCNQNKNLNLSAIDTILHKININFRLYARETFHFFNNIRSREQTIE